MTRTNTITRTELNTQNTGHGISTAQIMCRFDNLVGP